MSAAATSFARRPTARRQPPRLYAPRNAAAIIEMREAGQLKPSDSVVVSFIGSTPILAPHVFVDSGRRYDWACLKGLHVNIVVRPGVDARDAMCDLYNQGGIGLKPYVIDFDNKLLAMVFSSKPLSLLPERQGSGEWRRLFE